MILILIEQRKAAETNRVSGLTFVLIDGEVVSIAQVTLEAGPRERLERLFHADFAVVLALIHPNNRGVTLKVEKVFECQKFSKV